MQESKKSKKPTIIVEQMPRRKYWRMSGARKEIRTDKTEETGLMKNSKTLSDLDLTEETGLLKNSKTMYDIKMTEETGLVKNSKTNVDPEEPALRGSQCTCNALVMLIKSYEGFSFSTEFIDSTLIAGDQVYVMLVKNLQQRQMFLNKLLKLDELPSNLTLGENHHVIEKFETMWGLLVSEEQITQVKSLHQALEEAFQVSRYLLIMIGAICSGVYKVSDKEYYFFDSHSHDSAGMSSCDGKSVLVQSTGIDDLVSYLYSMYNSMHIDFAMQFEILPISIKTLHHSFPEKSPLQKNFYKMDDHLSSVTNPDQNLCRKRKLKSQNAEIRQKEKERDAAARKLKRQDAEIKEKEREMDKFARKSKRLDTEIKEKERKMNTAGRKIKRKDAEIKEKEREMDKFARKSKRLDTEIKEKERKMDTAGRKIKRKDAEIKEKERQMDKFARKSKRQDTEIKEKERKMNTA
ncbi:uncharacterized protein LOC134247866, partial [Saccostrea cucullata]|uniref:uncharacterized protein LOC134247866 n=1 Tax=Saccostrea cuccullata TaxID=36930 RepID=UPI002ED6A07B